MMYRVLTYLFHPQLQPLVFSDARSAAEHIKLPFFRKLGYAVGAMPYAMCTTVIGFYLSLFLLEVGLVSIRKKVCE